MEWKHLLLFAIVCLTWVPLFLNRSFVNWDDDENYTNNPLLTNGRSVTTQLLTPVLGTLEPFSNLIKLLVALVSQWKPKTSSARPFLLCNLFFHGLNTIMISKLTTSKLQRHKTQLQWNRFNLLLPLLFALHPLRVESVAWASCLPYELATFWCLLGCILHEKHYTTSKGVCFLLAILSKANSCTVPVALLAYDLVQVGHGRVTFRHVYVSVQKHLFSIGASCAGVLLAIGANEESPLVHDFSFDRKIVRASYAWWWYLVKSIVPYPLNVIYILPLGSTPGLDIVNTPYVTGWIPLAIPLAMTTFVHLWSMWVLGKAAMTTTAVTSTKAPGMDATAGGANTKPTRKKKQERSAIMQSIQKNNTTQKPPTTPSLTTSPPFSPSFTHRCATVVVMYTIVLLPCLGFVQHGYLTMAADRYSYLVSAVVLVPFFTIELDNLMSFYSSSLLFRRRIGTLSKNQKFHSKVITVLGCVVLGVYGKQMRVQLNVWQTSTRLWEHASALQPRSIEILGNLAQAYSLALRPKKALATYKKALAMEAMNPANANQESAELRHMYGQALKQSPSMADKEFARIQYEKALTLDSMLSETLVSLAWWHEEFKHEDHGAMSLMYYQQAENMALYSLTEEGKLKRKTTGSKTMPHKVLRDSSFWLSYGLCIDRVQKMHAKGHEEIKIQIPNLLALNSITKYKKAIQYDNTLAEAYYRLGKAVAPTSATEAHVFYSKALEHNVNFVDAMFAKANLYYTLRNKALGDQDTDNLHKGVVLYLRAIALEPKALDLRINLALAYRYVGQIELALETARSILAMDSFHRKASALIDDINAEE